MPFAHTYPNSDGTTICVWNVSETVDDLEATCRHRGIDAQTVMRTIKSPARQTERLVELLLLCTLCGHPIELSHTPGGAPYVIDGPAHLSITHTPGLVAIATHPQQPVGIDVERRTTRVLTVRERFLTPDELNYIHDNDICGNLVAWTAKEALFKVAGNPDAVMTDFTLDTYPTAPKGTVHFTAHYAKRTFNLATTIEQDTVLTIATEQIN